MMPQIPALETRSVYIQPIMNCDLQYSKTETASNSDLLFLLHVEIPNHKPWQDCESEVGSDKPRW